MQQIYTFVQQVITLLAFFPGNFFNLLFVTMVMHLSLETGSVLQNTPKKMVISRGSGVNIFT